MCLFSVLPHTVHTYLYIRQSAMLPYYFTKVLLLLQFFYFTDGKKQGFAFVSLSTHESADKVISELKSVSGRPVAVDWAVDKDKYQLKTTNADKSNTNNYTGKRDMASTGPCLTNNPTQ